MADQPLIKAVRDRRPARQSGTVLMTHTARRHSHQRSCAKTPAVRAVLSQTLRAGQSKGEVDARLNPDQMAAMMIAAGDAAPTLLLMVKGLDFAASDLLTLVVRRFLAPQRIVLADRLRPVTPSRPGP